MSTNHINRIDNFEFPPSFAAAWTIAALIIPSAALVYASEHWSGWPFILAVLGIVVVFLGALFMSELPGTKARESYLTYLEKFGLSELAQAANDPARPKYTRELVRQFLDQCHGGWHKTLIVN